MTEKLATNEPVDFDIFRFNILHMYNMITYNRTRIGTKAMSLFKFLP